MPKTLAICPSTLARHIDLPLLRLAPSGHWTRILSRLALALYSLPACTSSTQEIAPLRKRGGIVVPQRAPRSPYIKAAAEC